MQEYSVIVAPFQFTLSIFILRHLWPKIERVSYALAAVTVALDFLALFEPELFPLSSFCIIATILRYHGKSWGSVGFAFGMNGLMYVLYSKVPLGEFFVTAVNYYVAYNLLQALSDNEVYLKNALYYAAVKHLSIAATFWFDYPTLFRFSANAFSVVVSYYLIRASLYYLSKERIANAAQKGKTSG